MYTVIIPIIILFGIIFIKKIPVIGGSIPIGLAVTGMVAMLIAGIFNPIDWLNYFVDGLNRQSWVIFIILIGGFYAEMSMRIGTLDTVLDVCRSAFGKRPKGLVVCIIIVLTFAGSLIGDATAAGTVIGIMIIASLDDLGLKIEQTVCIVVCGACLGSIMPPVTQSIFLASSHVGADPVEVSKYAYFTVGFGVILMCIYFSTFVKIKVLPEHLIPKEKASEILKKRWKTLIPLMVLITLVVLRTGFKIDIATMILGPILPWLSQLPVVCGLSNLMVLNILMAAIVGLFYKPVHKNLPDVAKKAFKIVLPNIAVQMAAALMIGAFYNAGQIAILTDFASGLNSHIIKIGGGLALMLVGMLTGSQTTAQNTIFVLMAPVLLASGTSPVMLALAGAHLAMAGQGMPPADLAIFVQCGLAEGITKKKADPIRAMCYVLPQNLYFAAVGFACLYL